MHNRLEEQDGRLVAVPTGEREALECGLVFRSVGYRGVGLPELPFDERRGTIRNDGGRVVDAEGMHVAAAYCAGWIKRGPTGIIGTNKKDATETVTQLLEVGRPRVKLRTWDELLEAAERVAAETGAVNPL